MEWRRILERGRGGANSDDRCSGDCFFIDTYGSTGGHFISIMGRWHLLPFCLFHRCDGKMAHFRLPFLLVLLLFPVSFSLRRCCCIPIVVVVVYSSGTGVKNPLSLGSTFVAGAVILP